MELDNRVPSLNLTTVLQPDRTAPVTSYLNADDAVFLKRFDTEGYCMNFAYDGKDGLYDGPQ
jgi:hypothetical protein